MRHCSGFRWACPQCGKHNHAKRKRCRKCGHSMWATWDCLLCYGEGRVVYQDLVQMAQSIPELVPEPGKPFTGVQVCPVCKGLGEDPEMGVRNWVFFKE